MAQTDTPNALVRVRRPWESRNELGSTIGTLLQIIGDYPNTANAASAGVLLYVASAIAPMLSLNPAALGLAVPIAAGVLLDGLMKRLALAQELREPLIQVSEALSDEELEALLCSERFKVIVREAFDLVEKAKDEDHLLRIRNLILSSATGEFPHDLQDQALWWLKEFSDAHWAELGRACQLQRYELVSVQSNAESKYSLQNIIFDDLQRYHLIERANYSEGMSGNVRTWFMRATPLGRQLVEQLLHWAHGPASPS